MKLKVLLFALVFALSSKAGISQYVITDEIDISKTYVKHQQNTGTCWSFATISFIESELIRMGKGEIDLSEMFNVRKVYEDKALNYVLRQGKANFTEGSLAHDVINTINKFGVVPDAAYSGLINGNTVYDHSELSASLKTYLDGLIKSGKPEPNWLHATNKILDSHLGEVSEKFDYNGKEYTPKSFAIELGLNSDDYIHFTSFSHHPFYKKFILEIPDNYSNQDYNNLPIKELKQVVDYALENGYSISWDGDVSEKGFSQAKGLAIIPVEADKGDMFNKYVEEVEVNQENRQANFFNYSTTDDHLMHLIGQAKDEKGTVYYKIKNSWGDSGKYNGYLYMSESYFLMKTVGITLHKDGVPHSILEKLK